MPAMRDMPELPPHGTLPAADPGAAGFDPARLKRLDAYLRESVERQLVPGLNALVVRHGKTAYAATLGYADLESRLPMRPYTLFRIYSLTKPIVSAAVMTFLEEGRFLLTDPVRDFIPEIDEMKVYAGEGNTPVPQDPPMTIADLMTHTSGLTYGGDPADPVEKQWDAARLFRHDGTMEDVVPRLCALPLKFQPGAAFEYSIAHDVLGLLLERAAQKPLGEILHERILEPLDMTDTGFAVPASRLDRLAVLYEREENGTLRATDTPSPESRWAAPVSFEAGGQGLVSSLPDFYRFVAMLLHRGEMPGRRLLSRKSVELLTANRLNDAQRKGMWMAGYGFGLGFGVLIDPALNANLGSAGEFTWAGSASTFFWADPREDLIGILFSQLEPSGSHMMARTFKALMYQALI